MDLRERGGGERRHPWEVARADFFRRLVADHVDLAAVRRVLDVGAGDGWFAQELAGDLPVGAVTTCWDVNYRSADLAAPAGIVRTTDRPDEQSDLVLVLDVLEHVDDDTAFLADSVAPAMAADGTLVVSVPAHPLLYGDHDRMLEHRRRYRRAELLDLLTTHVDVRASGALFTTLLAPRAITVIAERLGRHRDPTGVGTWRRGPAVTRATTAVLAADATAGRWLADHGVAVPGLSLWAVCGRRP